jgi:Holliday junction resolvase
MKFLSTKLDDQKNEKKVSQIAMKFSAWDFPSPELLNKNTKKYEIDKDFVEKQSLEIQKTLLEFNIKVSMDKYTV